MRLAASPLTERENNDLRRGIREIVVYPTVLFYRVSREQVEIVRVVDVRRDLAPLFGKD
jgi:plasmid stabilization system protein ParE